MSNYKNITCSKLKRFEVIEKQRETPTNQFPESSAVGLAKMKK